VTGRLATQFKNTWKLPKFTWVSEFDSNFYFNYYSDLFHFKSKAARRRHYVVHGRQEGRFANFGAAKNSFEKRFGILPEDFDLASYKLLNQDLCLLFDHDCQFILHFLEHGRKEGRLHKLNGGRANGEVGSSYDQVEWTKSSWIGLFRFADFVSCAYDWLDELPQTPEQAIRVFVDAGIDRIAPFNLEYIFDPIFYRSTYELGKLSSDVELYRHWLETGVLQGFFPNEERALGRFVGHRRYPPCFDWPAYKSALRRGRSLRNRIDALQHLFDYGFEAGVTGQITGEGADELFASIGDYHLIRGHYPLAIAAYDRAVALGSNDVRVLHRRGDARSALNDSSGRHADFVQAAAHPNASIWSHINAARAAASNRSFEESFAILAKARPKWSKNAEYRAIVMEIVEQFFANETRLAIASYDSGDRRAGDAQMYAAVEEVHARILQFEDLPTVLPHAGKGHVAILANQELPQCTHYRVEQKIRQLKRAGIDVEIFNQNDPTRFIESLLGARAAIFYRVPADPGTIRAILTASALGVPTYYELDDLLFDPKYYPDTFDSYEEQISKADYINLLTGVPLFRYAMGLCQHGIASTTLLGEQIKGVVQNRDCLVLRNGLDERNEKAIAMGATSRRERDTVSIFYGSGTKAHNSDFNELVGPALLSVLEQYDHVRLVIVGHLQLRPEFERFSPRIKKFGFTSDLDQYWSILAACDVNIAVLAPGLMTDCKSEIKWLEAAVLQVPSIVSGTATYREILEDSVDVLFAENESQWKEALHRFVIDRQLRRTIGAAARTKALQRYSLDGAAKTLHNALDFSTGSSGHSVVAFTKREHVKAAAKIKVLICHVFFPPQTYGGATRVVKDNVDYIKDRCSDIELSVFTSDAGVSPPGRLRFDQYRGIPVFRLSTPLEVNMDWRPFNPDNEEPFQRVLDMVQPDLIHFQCIQRLTTSIVEVALRRSIPYLITAHDAWWVSDHQFLVDEDGILRVPSTDAFSTVPPTGISLIDSISRRGRLALALACAKHVIVVSETFDEIYCAAGCRNTIVIPNGVSAIAPAVRGSPSGRLSLGHLGGRSTHKGATLIEAILRTTTFDNLKLTMVDMRMDPGVCTETVWGNTPILLRGPCPQSEVGELYGSLDVLLAPSIWPESFGLVTREAKALGLWVIASNRGAIGKEVSHGKNGFVIDVSDARALLKMLKALDADVPRFKMRPPRDETPGRQAADQGRELTELYRSTAMRSNIKAFRQDVT
jgi:glycosyltransferase involved in cell wall biosynthesis